jgi:hypothetical protein
MINTLRMRKSINKSKYITISPKQRKSKSYVLIHGISGSLCLFAAVALLIAMFTEHMSWGLIFLILFCFLLGFIEIASARTVQKHGAKVMPRQVIYPTVRLWKDNGLDPNEMNNPLHKPRNHH